MTAYARWKLRGTIVFLLAVLPVAFVSVVGMYHLWATGWSFVAYWPMAACFLGAYGLGWYWSKGLRRNAADAEVEPPAVYWTDLDRRAWEAVETTIAAMPPVPSAELTELSRYAEQTQQLARVVAAVYRPGQADPFAHLTMPEILACGELITQDLTQLVRGAVPGSHLFTLGDILRARNLFDQVTTWYPRLRNVYWAASLAFNPIKTVAQIAYTKGMMGPAQEGMKSNALQWFQAVYLREVGRYLIELNSGRLKVGAKRYLELVAATADPGLVAAPSDEGETRSPKPEALPLTVALVGPVKAGKSSLANALLGEQLAATDVLPLTAGLVRYALRRPGLPALTVLDSAGFGHSGPTEDDVQVALSAAKEADVLLLVVPARSAARAPEADFLNRLVAAMAATPNLKPPPLLAVLTHIDLLTPAMEWSPPYDFAAGTRPKEVNVRDAVTAATELFGQQVSAVVPVCASPGKVTGVQDDLLAAILTRVGEARGVSLLRALFVEADADKARRVWHQVQTAGGHAARLLWDWARK
jgi:predicted GTPase